MSRRDPFSEIEELLERVGQEFEELGGTLDTPDAPRLPGARDVDVDVLEDDGTVTVHADLPGFDEDDIEVELHDDALTIAATREEESEVETVSGGGAGAETDEGDAEGAEPDAEPDVRYHRRERRTRAVSRRVPVPAPVERDGATASYEDGVLTVTLPKRSGTESGGHSIDVS